MVLTENLITQVIADLKTNLEAVITHGAVGDDNTTATEADTALGNEDFRDSIDEFDDSPSAGIVASLRVLTTENNGNDIKEFGFFNANSGGTMWSRNTTTTITKTNDIQVFADLQIDFNVTQS